MAFCVQLLLLSRVHLRFTHVVACNCSAYFFSSLLIIPLNGQTITSLHLHLTYV